MLVLQSIYRRPEPVVNVSRQQQINQNVVLSQWQEMVGDEHFEIGLLQNVKRRSRRILVQGRHAVHLQEVILCLHVPQVAACHCSERNLSVCRSIREAEQKRAAVVKEEYRVLEIAEFLPKRRYVNRRLCFCS